MDVIKLQPEVRHYEIYPGVPLTFRVKNPVVPEGQSLQDFTFKAWSEQFTSTRPLELSKQPVLTVRDTEPFGVDIKFTAAQTAKLTNGAYLEIWYGDQIALGAVLTATKSSGKQGTREYIDVPVVIGSSRVEVPIAVVNALASETPGGGSGPDLTIRLVSQTATTATIEFGDGINLIDNGDTITIEY